MYSQAKTMAVHNCTAALRIFDRIPHGPRRGCIPSAHHSAPLCNFAQSFVPPIGNSLRSLFSLIWVEGPEDRRMDAKKIKDIRRRLSSEYETLVKSINRNRTATDE